MPYLEVLPNLALRNRIRTPGREPLGELETHYYSGFRKPWPRHFRKKHCGLTKSLGHCQEAMAEQKEKQF
jgi:hypothetical protein